MAKRSFLSRLLSWASSWRRAAPADSVELSQHRELWVPYLRRQYGLRLGRLGPERRPPMP